MTTWGYVCTLVEGSNVANLSPLHGVIVRALSIVDKCFFSRTMDRIGRRYTHDLPKLDLNSTSKNHGNGYYILVKSTLAEVSVSLCGHTRPRCAYVLQKVASSAPTVSQYSVNEHTATVTSHSKNHSVGL